MAASSSGFLTGIIIDLVVLLISLVAFSALRITKFSRKFYAPKSFMALPHKPHELPNTFFGWILPVWRYKEPDIITQAGLDTAMYLRVLSFGIELFLWTSLWCLAAMLPTNLTSNNVDQLMASSPDFKFTDFDKLGLANIEESSQKMWVHLGSVYAVTLITLWLLYKYSKESVLLRIMFLANSAKGRSTHTILVTDIPAVADDTKQQLGDIKARRKSSRRSAQTKDSASTVDNEAFVRSQDSDVVGEDAVRVNIETPGRPVAMPGPSAPPGPVAEGVQSPVPEVKQLGGSEVVGQEVNPGGAQGQGQVVARHRFTYDLKDESLNPEVMAKKAIKSGVGPKEMVEQEFHGVYPGGAVVAVEMAKDQKDLGPLVLEYNKYKQALEDYLDECEYRLSKGMKLERKKIFICMPLLGPWAKPHYGGGFIKRVDAFDHYTTGLRALDTMIAEEQELSRRMVWPSAFVTFRSRVNHAAATAVIHQHDTSTWLTRPAPEPDEMIWSNLAMTLPMRSSTNTLMWVLFWLMCFFYMIPVGAIQALIEAPRLASNPVLGPLVGNAVIGKLLQSIIPGLVLKIFLVLVPMILCAMIKAGGAVSLNEVDMGVVTRFFIFQIIVVFFGTVIAGSFFSQVMQWIENPTSVISVLGTSIPMVCTFFITYIAVNGLLVKPLAAIRIVGLAIFWILSKLSGSPKARDRIWQEQYTTYGTSVIDHVITILLGLVYSCINPIICPFCLAYFFINCIIERYQNIYVFRRNYESAGQLWPRIFNQVLVAVYIMQITMLGLLGIKKFVYTVILIPVLFVTLIFHVVCLRLFGKPWRLLSLHDAAQLDRLDQQAEEAQALVGETAASFDHAAYLSPVFKVVHGEINPLLEEASGMAARVDRGTDGASPVSSDKQEKDGVVYPVKKKESV